jgi:hypothetical protein
VSSADPFFNFKCDIDGKFAHVRLYRGRITWQVARVSSTVRLLLLGIPSGLILGVILGIVAAWAFASTFHGIWDVIFGVGIGIAVGLVFGYRLAALLGEVIFSTRKSPVESLAVGQGVAITTRNAGRMFSFIRLAGGAGSVEFRVGPKFVDLLVAKLRATGGR